MVTGEIIMRLKFAEVKEIFESYGIWSGGKEILWYEKAWKTLDRGGLTSYKNSIERALVIIRVFTLILIYSEFCELAFGEISYCEFIDWEEDSGLNAFKLGQVAGMVPELRDIYDDEFWDYYCNKYRDNYDFKEVLDILFFDLVERQRYKVFDGLADNIGVGRECDIYVSMYLATIIIPESEGDIRRVDAPQSNHDWSTIKQLTDYEKYESEIERYYEEILSAGEYTEAWSWALSGTYRIG